MSPGPSASVIALFDRGRLEPCLSSLLAQEGVEFEAILVFGDETLARAIPPDPRLRPLTVQDRNPALRRNLAAARATGQFLAFIDDDAAAPPDWLQTGTRRLEADPLLAGVSGPNLIPADAGFAERVTDMVLTAPLLGAGGRAYRAGGRAAEAGPGEVHLVNFMVRREWFERLGGFNEALGYGGEDTEFVARARKLGGRFRFAPELFVSHRRRPFGPAYFRQRFLLRRQSGRLFVAQPGVYAGSLSFWLALLSLPVGAALLIWLWLTLGPTGLAAAAGAYVLATALASWSSWRERPVLLAVAPAAFLLHHLINLSGLWLGVGETIVRRLFPPGD